MHPLLIISLAMALLAAAWSAGFFWAWSATVMPGLSAAPPEAAIAAMRAVNANIRGLGFGFVFFGPCAFALLSGALALAAGLRAPGLAAFTGAAIYGVGVIGVTFAVNLPLNDALAAAVPAPPTAETIWRDYAKPWTAWNHVRAGAASLAFITLGAAAMLAGRAWDAHRAW